jgi:DNA-binding transcriptional LysR family regulator
MADRRLQVFHTVARLLSFTKAAETLHMTQPAVTFQVRQLEDYFNTRLFDRTHNRISLTQAGERVFEYSERILDLYGEMDNSVRELTGEISGVLMLGASTTIAEYMLPEMLGAFKKKYPNLVVRLKVGNTDGVVQMIENNVIDLGIVEAPVLNKKLQVELCRNDELVLVVPPKHPLAGKTSVSLKEIVQYPYIWREEGSGTREVIRDQLEHAGINPDDLDVVMELGSLEAVKGAVEAGIGMTILSQSSIQKELRLGTVIAIPLEPRLTRPFSFVHQKQKFRLRAIEELLEFAREYCAQQSKK